ncbi:hypothetical protein RvY_04931-2 [Ramazzottius varieornatus]|uniref:Uncharacterized protein n=1 Tax=Ramazzottius varieornatus TaxID=947166 RepID=A0A1D1V2F8_RAMVA|nr:hypothetical protein RvY_04931-2 [Ramazzottius varieornatus]
MRFDLAIPPDVHTGNLHTRCPCISPCTRWNTGSRPTRQSISLRHQSTNSHHTKSTTNPLNLSTKSPSTASSPHMKWLTSRLIASTSHLHLLHRRLILQTTSQSPSRKDTPRPSLMISNRPRTRWITIDLNKNRMRIRADRTDTRNHLNSTNLRRTNHRSSPTTKKALPVTISRSSLNTTNHSVRPCSTKSRCHRHSQITQAMATELMRTIKSSQFSPR